MGSPGLKKSYDRLKINFVVSILFTIFVYGNKTNKDMDNIYNTLWNKIGDLREEIIDKMYDLFVENNITEIKLEGYTCVMLDDWANAVNVEVDSFKCENDSIWIYGKDGHIYEIDDFESIESLCTYVGWIEDEIEKLK